MNLYQLHSNPKTLYGYERMLEIPKIAYKQAEDKYYETGLRSPELEQVIGRDPQTAYLYALNILKRRWADIGMPEVEQAIGRDPMWACHYAIFTLKRRWADIGMPEVEQVISRSPMWDYHYARYVLKRR